MAFKRLYFVCESAKALCLLCFGRFLLIIYYVNKDYLYHYQCPHGRIRDMLKKTTSLCMVLLLFVLLFAPMSAAATGSVTVSVIGEGSVSVSVGDFSQSYGTGTADATGSYNYDETQPYVVSVSASPAANATLASIVINGTSYFENTKTITLDGSTTGVSVTATFNTHISTYGISLTQPTGGSITASASEAEAGASINVSATAEAGYRFKSWSANAGSFQNAQSTSTTFTMPGQSATISAEFEKTYELTLKGGDGGTVSTKGGSFTEGEKIELAVSEKEGYKFSEWKSSKGGSFSDKNDPDATFTMPASDTTVTAVFESEIELRTLTTQAGEGGQIIVNQKSVKPGVQITVRAVAKDGYHFVKWSSTGGGTFADAEAATTTFTMPDADVTIIAEFAEGSADADKSGGFSWWIIIVIVAVLLVAAGIVLFVLERQNKIDLFGRNKKKKNKSTKTNRAATSRRRDSDDYDEYDEDGGYDTSEGATAEFDTPADEGDTRDAGDTQDFFFYRFDD